MSESYNHEKVTTVEPQKDGSVIITTESYYEKDTPAFVVKEREKQLLSTDQTYLKDAIACIEPFQKGSPRVTITLERKKGGLVKIIRRFTMLKQDNGKL